MTDNNELQTSTNKYTVFVISEIKTLLDTKGEANKEQVLSLAMKGIDDSKPEDVLCDPYVFEFLAIPETKPILESDLEAALVRQI